ncbi:MULTISPECIES: type II toxin-antitoxin system RelB/DinJ family antitoxin [Asaia]|uniref:type II toxin-antitoxin system RelB/DinJ family antitoxin n=1 Tax=Asaia TaxID=91914 RepID=UPI00255378E2|nr:MULTISPECIES: type II toxin-antitoxin system RelB/DinJ family antitoxin [Asaia]MDL2172531.1 type II toxin-antitoxin system RelB/DinJ family antitoxin [Asaia sp. HumB]MDR6184040.1 RHH-type rel operon transcriptional repressor/antitoxin RelB [Asaia bogorensis NBRC 16594]
MASITSSTDDAPEAAAYRRLSGLVITHSDLIRQTLEYVVETGKLPVQRVALSRDDRDLLPLVCGAWLHFKAQFLPAWTICDTPF